MDSSPASTQRPARRWQAHLFRDWMGLEFVAPRGTKYMARLEAGVIDRDLHRFFGALRGERPVGGWKVWAPLEWKGRSNVDQDGGFGVLCLRNPRGVETAVEFYYRRGPAELLEALERIVETAKELEDGTGQPHVAAVSEAGGRPEAEGAGEQRPEVDQEGGRLRWRPWGRGKAEGLIGGGGGERLTT